MIVAQTHRFQAHGRQATALARRAPLTLGLLALLVACGAVTGSLWHPAAASTLLAEVGYGLPALRMGRPWTLLTGIPFALYPWMILTIAFIIVLFVGVYELQAGTVRAAVVFLTTQVGGTYLAVAAVIQPLAAQGWPLAVDWARRLDVGASAGAYGCAGALTAGLPYPWRIVTRIGLVAFLVAQLATSRQVWDVEHLVAAPLGILLGEWLNTARSRRPTGPARIIAIDGAVATSPDVLPRRRPTRSRGWARAILALLVGLVGVFNILSALVAGVATRVARWPEIVPLGLLHGTRTFVVVAGFGLLLLARGLWDGRRIAWGTALTLLSGTALAHLVKGLDLEESMIQVVLVGMLLWRAHDFRARPDVPTVAGALRAAAVGLLALPLYALAGFLLLDESFRPTPSREEQVREFLARLALSSTHQFQGTRFQSRWFLDSITFAWVAVLLYVVVALLRAARPSAIARSDDRARARALLQLFGHQTIAHMTIWPGNSLLFSRDGDAYVAYRVLNDVALMLGDPIGDDNAAVRVIEQFLDRCATRGWTPCSYAATGRYLQVYRAHGLQSLQVAEDAIIDLPALEFKGKVWQDVRTALNKAERAKIRCEWVDVANAPVTIADQLATLSADWVTDKGLPELGFTLGTLAEACDPTVRTAIAIDEAGIIHGFTTWLPIYAGGAIHGWTLDMMRRRDGPNAFRPAMEFLIARAALTFREEGAAIISLSSAPLARVGREGEEALGLRRALDLLADRLEPLYGFRSLLAFKQKFRPRWEPIYLVFPGVGALPRISLAILRAYLPGLGLRAARELLDEAVHVRRDALPSGTPSEN